MASRWLLLPALAGLALGVGYLPGPFLALSFSAFLPMLAWLDIHRDTTRYARFKAGFVFGVVAYLIMLHFTFAMLAFSWLASLLYVGMTLAFALRVSLTVMVLGWLRRGTGLSWGLLLPVCWLSAEWAQTWGDLRTTADHFAYSVSGYPFLFQFADLVGPFGVGAFLLACNGLLMEVIAPPRPGRRGRSAAALALLVVAVLAYDLWAWSRPLPSERTVRVALVQPNVALEVKHDEASYGSQWSELVEMTVRAARDEPDLILWPETARPLPLFHFLDRPSSYAMAEVQALARRIGVPLILGVEYYRLRGPREFDLYNAAMAVDAEGRLLRQWGAKVYLVPFTEKVPFDRLLGPLVEGRGGEWRWVAGAFTPAEASALFDVAGMRVGALVCYEQLFPELSRRLARAGAELQVVITNDAWFGRTFFQTHQANALRFRAVENRTPFVRVANTGISGFVDRRGRYRGRTALFEKAVESHELSLRAGETVYGRIGDVVAWLALACLAAAALAASRGPR